MKNISIETSRFDLKTLQKNDVSEKYLSWINNSDNLYIAYSREIRSLADIQFYVEQREKDATALFLGIFMRDSGEHIGNIKYEPINIAKHQATMGIMIGEKNWRGKGVATEVINKSVQWLYENLAINQILLGVSINNIGAIRAYEKSGFKENKLLKCSENQIMMQLDILKKLVGKKV